jgi:hypothetical protein
MSHSKTIMITIIIIMERVTKNSVIVQMKKFLRIHT